MEPRTRRNMIRDLIYGLGANSVGALVNIADDETSLEDMRRLRPPGSHDDTVFKKHCTKCGDCIQACPHTTLKIDQDGIIAEGFPYFEAREKPCYMCEDTPCISSCTTDALGREQIINDEPVSQVFNMGLAIVDNESCLAYEGVSCDVCYQACPLKDAALSMRRNATTVESESPLLIPVVSKEYCTGCGQCEYACVVENSAIYTLPQAVVERGLESIDRKKKNSEQDGFDNKEGHETDDRSLKNVLAYLNVGGELFD